MTDPGTSGPVPAAGEREECTLVHAANVMAMLEHYGPGIVGHLLDTDDNQGEYLRRDLATLGIEADWTPPAVPVGVQPEPAEDAKWVDLFGIDPTFDEPAPSVVHPEPAEERCGCGHAMAEHRVGASDYSCRSCSCDLATPAVPVVHPEPGDREARWIETLSTRLKRSSPDWPQRLNFLRACMDVADVEVAAVRADLAVKLETLLEAAERIGFDHSGESPDCAACETYTAAAAVRSATKEGLG